MCSVKCVYMMWASKPVPLFFFFPTCKSYFGSELKYFSFWVLYHPKWVTEQRFGHCCGQCIKIFSSLWMWFSRLTDLTCDKPHSEDGVRTAVVSERLGKLFSVAAETCWSWVWGTTGPCRDSGCLRGGDKDGSEIYQENQLSKVPFLLDVWRWIYNFVSPVISYIFK